MFSLSPNPPHPQSSLPARCRAQDQPGIRPVQPSAAFPADSVRAKLLNQLTLGTSSKTASVRIYCSVLHHDSHSISGFKDKGDKTAEKVPAPGQQSRTTSNTSLGPPSGTRVVLGRETSPTPSSQNQRIPPEILAKFQGKTREDLIELVVGLQANAETQGKKLKDLEDYLDGLLIRVMETAPVLLQKDTLTTKPGRQ